MNLVQRNVVLGVIAAALAVPTFLQLQRDADSFVDVGRVPLLFDGFTADNVGVITIGQPKKEQPVAEPNNPNAPKVLYDQLVLQRSDKGWMLAQVPGQDLPGAPVSKDLVEANLFAHLRAIRIDRDVLVQPNATPDQLEKFGLDEAHAFVIVATDATQRNVIADLMVGKDAGAGQTGSEAVRGVYVRKRDSNDVVLYEYEKTWLRSAQREQWLDKTLAKLDPDKILKLRIVNAATPEAVVFEKKDGKASWTAVSAPAGVGAVRQTEVENLVQRLRYLAVQDFRTRIETASNLAQLGLQPGKIQIDFTVKDGDKVRDVKLSVGNQLEGKNEFYLQCTEQPQFVMTWPAGAVTPFELDVKAQCFDPAAPAPGTGDKPAEPKKDEK